MTDPGGQSDRVQQGTPGPYSICRSRGSVCGVFQGEFGKCGPQVIKVDGERSDNSQTFTGTGTSEGTPNHIPQPQVESTRAIAPTFGSIAVLAPLPLSSSPVFFAYNNRLLRRFAPKPTILAFDAASSLHRTRSRRILDR